MSCNHYRFRIARIEAFARFATRKKDEQRFGRSERLHGENIIIRVIISYNFLHTWSRFALLSDAPKRSLQEAQIEGSDYRSLRSAQIERCGNERIDGGISIRDGFEMKIKRWGFTDVDRFLPNASSSPFQMGKRNWGRSAVPQLTRCKCPSSLHPCKPSGNVRRWPNDMARVHVILITTCTWTRSAWCRSRAGKSTWVNGDGATSGPGMRSHGVAAFAKGGGV